MNTMIQNSAARRTASARTMTLVVGLMLASLAMAQPARAQASGDRWQVTIAPYVWGAALDGTAMVKGTDADVDVSRSDVFDHMDAAFMSTALVRKGDWGLLADAVWVELAVTSDMPPAEFDPTLGLFSLQGVRRINEFADVTAGVRWNHLKGQLDVKAPIAMEVERTRDWVDPIVGFTLRTPGAQRWHGTLIADVGGFGVGSDLSWEVFPSVGFDVTRQVSLEVGWRFLDTDYKTGEGADRFEYDMLLDGPATGLAIKF